MKHLFPLNEKDHQMNMRKGEKYRVQFSNTDRLQNSAIPYMQNLLNQQWKNPPKLNKNIRELSELWNLRMNFCVFSVVDITMILNSHYIICWINLSLSLTHPIWRPVYTDDCHPSFDHEYIVFMTNKISIRYDKRMVSLHNVSIKQVLHVQCRILEWLYQYLHSYFPTNW